MENCNSWFCNFIFIYFSSKSILDLNSLPLYDVFYFFFLMKNSTRREFTGAMTMRYVCSGLAWKAEQTASVSKQARRAVTKRSLSAENKPSTIKTVAFHSSQLPHNQLVMSTDAKGIKHNANVYLDANFELIIARY